MANLITLSDVKTYLGITGTDEDTLLNMLISDASSMIENELGSVVAATDITEVRTGDLYPYLYLDNYPLISLYSISTQVSNVLTVSYSGTSPVATLSVEADRVMVRTVNNGAYVTSDLNFSSYPVLSDMSNAIDSLTGFSVSLDSTYKAFPSLDLVEYGPQNAKETAYLSLWEQDYDQIKIKSLRYSSLYNPYSTGDDRFGNTYNWPYSSQNGWPSTINGIRVVYRAGYETIPHGIVSACNELIKLLYDHNQSSSVYNKEQIGDYSYSQGTIGTNTVTGRPQTMLSPVIAYKLEPYGRVIVH